MKLIISIILLFTCYLGFAQSSQGCDPGDETLGAFVNADGDSVYYCKKPQGTKYYKTYVLNVSGGSEGSIGTGNCDPKAMCVPTGREDTSGYGTGVCINTTDPKSYGGPVKWIRVCFD